MINSFADVINRFFCFVFKVFRTSCSIIWPHPLHIPHFQFPSSDNCSWGSYFWWKPCFAIRMRGCISVSCFHYSLDKFYPITRISTFQLFVKITLGPFTNLRGHRSRFLLTQPTVTPLLPLFWPLLLSAQSQPTPISPISSSWESIM